MASVTASADDSGRVGDVVNSTMLLTEDFVGAVAAVAAESKSLANVSILPYPALAKILCEAPARAKSLLPLSLEPIRGGRPKDSDSWRLNRALWPPKRGSSGQNLMPFAVRSRFFEKLARSEAASRHEHPLPAAEFWSSAFFDPVAASKVNVVRACP